MFLLSGLGSVTFAASARGWRDVCLFAAGLLATAFLLRSLPDPALVGGASAVFAGWRLLRPRIELVFPLLGGALAGVLFHALRAEELALPLAVLGAAPAIVSVAFAVRGRSFAPENTRNEALLLVIALGTVTALAPGVMDGWQSATGLTLQENKLEAPMMPVWVLWTAALSAIAGGAFSVWRRS